MSAPAALQPVGVVIPTFNRRDYLRAALESVIRQAHGALEILVVDNGSTDGTPEYMATVADSRVRYVVNPRNLGMAGSVNVGVSLLADAVQWATVLSDDDLLDPGCVRAALARAAETPQASVIDVHRVFIDAHGHPIRDARRPPLQETALDFLDARSRGRREIYLTGLLFRRAAFRALGGYPTFSTGLASDDALLFALALGGPIAHAADAVARIRIHGDAESRSARDGAKKLRTVDEFCDYCASAFDRTCPHEGDRRRFARALVRYRRALKSHWWQVTARAAADGLDGYGPEDAPGLRAIVREHPDHFSWLIRASVRLERTAGIDLESAPWYRAVAAWVGRNRGR